MVSLVVMLESGICSVYERTTGKSMNVDWRLALTQLWAVGPFIAVGLIIAILVLARRKGKG